MMKMPEERNRNIQENSGKTALKCLWHSDLEGLTESERNYRLLVKEMELGLALHRLIRDYRGKAVDFEIISINPCFEKMTGINRDHFIGKKASEVIRPGERDWMDLFCDSVLGEREINGKYYSMSLNRHLQLKTYLPEEDYVALLIDDISDQVFVQEEINESNNQLQGILSAVPDPLIMMDPEGEISKWNKAAEMVFQYTSEEAIGKDLHRLLSPQSFHGKFAEAHRHFRLKGEGDAIGKTLELTGRRKNGEEFPMELSLSAIRLRRGWYSIGIVRDITMRKQEERELKLAKSQAEEASLDKSRFMAKISHEVRSPLNGILGFLELLKDTDLDGEQREYLETIAHSSRSLEKIIGDLFDFEKIRMGQMHLENELISIRELIGRVVETNGRKAEEKGIGILTEIGQDLPEEVFMDSTRVQQILNNLMSNSIKFTEKGKVSLSAEGYTDQDCQPWIQFQVKDTGIGIAGDGLDKLFTPFYQGERQEIHKEKGTGLGMPITKELVELMEGRISVASEKSFGTTVTVKIPLAACPV